jgi:hypothetical protein
VTVYHSRGVITPMPIVKRENVSGPYYGVVTVGDSAYLEKRRLASAHRAVFLEGPSRAAVKEEARRLASKEVGFAEVSVFEYDLNRRMGINQERAFKGYGPVDEFQRVGGWADTR